MFNFNSGKGKLMAPVAPINYNSGADDFINSPWDATKAPLVVEQNADTIP